MPLNLKKLNDDSNILVRLIDSFQEKGVIPNFKCRFSFDKPPDNHFHPSSDCLPSAKELYFIKTGQMPDQKVGVSLRRAFDYGTMLHGYYEAILIEMGLVAKEDVEKSHTHNITTEHGTAIAKGTGDLVNVNIPGYGKWLVDIKTMSGPEIPDHLMRKYIAQVNVYADFFDLDNIMILGVAKTSPHSLREYIIQKDQNMIDMIYEKWTRVSTHIDLGYPPT